MYECVCVFMSVRVCLFKCMCVCVCVYVCMCGERKPYSAIRRKCPRLLNASLRTNRQYRFTVQQSHNLRVNKLTLRSKIKHYSLASGTGVDSN